MAYVAENLAPVGNTSKPFSAIGAPGAPSFWAYASNDLQADINTSGYFNDASSILNVWDSIRAVVDIDGTAAVVDFIVLSNTGGVVDLSNGVTIALTDSD